MTEGAASGDGRDDEEAATVAEGHEAAPADLATRRPDRAGELAAVEAELAAKGRQQRASDSCDGASLRLTAQGQGVLPASGGGNRPDPCRPAGPGGAVAGGGVLRSGGDVWRGWRRSLEALAAEDEAARSVPDLAGRHPAVPGAGGRMSAFAGGRWSRTMTGDSGSFLSSDGGCGW
ncbi:Os04g0115000 [Oryza sativa Japonica Group]|uniref:Os04g0115000 protein n=1 Tax=Oryza sativa subsp. japonica TaxID=39947 RepID=A3AQ97_ORYSJ|nr:hypothetical protein OsJ_13562 [Oryza sativa Japonica Group]BAH92466.1 Os04g0115000 [Oryza sativa Japonica Group]|eukprot:NP_001173738.1 Os04g0115000 [Oryza sativa Japonica Group]